MVTREIHKIDAEGKVFGRLSSQIALLLRGKNKVTFQPHIDGGDIVEVSNVDKVRFTGNKLVQEKYYRHSGHPGGLRETNLGARMASNPKELLRKSVLDMLPKNKLRALMIRRLKFVE